MKSKIVHTSEPVALIGGGALLTSDFDVLRRYATHLVAADGGARAAIEHGWMPDAVIGDFDSIDAETKARIPADRLHPMADQNSTDFDKALSAISAPLVIGAGFLGARVDHQLAALRTLVRYADRRCLLLGEVEIIVHLPPVLSLPITEGETVSIFPMAPVSGRSTGLFWPIDGLLFEPDGQIGTSNRATGPVRIEMEGPGAIGLFPRARLDDLMRSLLSPDAGRWPARA